MKVNQSNHKRESDSFYAVLDYSGLPNANDFFFDSLTLTATLAEGGDYETAPGSGVMVDATSEWSGEADLTANPENFTYDADGNLTSDARWQYTWDSRSRLTTMIFDFEHRFQYD